MTENKVTIRPERISIDTLGQMISRLEDRIILKIDVVGDKVDNLGQRVDDLEKNMNYRFDSSTRQVDNFYLNYTTAREHSLLKERVKRVEHKVGIKT